MPATSLSLELYIVIIFSHSVVCLFSFLKFIYLAASHLRCIMTLRLWWTDSLVVVRGVGSHSIWA